MNIVCGIDVSKIELEGTLSGKTATFKNGSADFGRLVKFAKDCNCFAMEATGSYHEALAEYLHKQGKTVYVINPARISAFAKALGARSKTDKVDARIIALYAERMECRPYEIPPKELVELRSLLRLRSNLVTQRAAVKTQLQDPGLKRIYGMLSEQLKFYSGQIKELQDQMRELCKAHPGVLENLKLLQTIPGVGELLAFHLLAEGMLTQFEGAKQVAAYAGVCPQEKVSGTSIRGKTKMSKTGNAFLRKALYMPALSAIRTPGVFQDLYVRMVAKGKAKFAAIGAVMHKLLRTAFGVLKNKTPYQSKFHLTT